VTPSVAAPGVTDPSDATARPNWGDHVPLQTPSDVVAYASYLVKASDERVTLAAVFTNNVD